MARNNSVKFGFIARSNNWTSLRLFNIYRIGLASIFFSQSYIPSSPLLNIYSLPLFAWTSFGYLLLAVLITLASWIDRRNFQLQVSIQLYIDIIAIILLMHACGGISSGIGMLLIISIAVASLLGKYPLAILFASIATVGLLGEFIYSDNYTFYSGTSTQVGLLGVALFATALITQSLTQRIRSSEVLIQQQKLDVANLSALNTEILQNMHSGVLALDSQDQVRHINDIAKNLLQSRLSNYDNHIKTPFAVDSILPDVYQALLDWRASPPISSQFPTYIKGARDIQISFHKLQTASHQGTLVFLDDVSGLKLKMQQSKLASLGQLTANIAHEIRNPLAAISHAGQLLAENQDLPATEKRLTEIIQQHSNRINAIIEDILQISKGRIASEDHIKLNDWMPRFIDNFCLSGEAHTEYFDLDMESDNLSMVFDSGHLNRIMTNLCSNALTHSHTEQPISLKIYQNDEKSTTIEVADHGEGIDAKELDRVFEPFYTTSHKGTGLGLYIVNQLCELNNATITVANNEYGGASFIIEK